MSEINAVPAATMEGADAPGNAAIDARARVTVVTVTHNSAHVIGPCLAALEGFPHVVLVDNASTDDTLARVAEAAPAARVLRNAVGLGYGNGANRGLAEVMTEFALLINPDATISAQDLDRLVAAADAFPGAAMLGPLVRRPDGGIERSHDVPLFDRAAIPRGRGEEIPEGICSTWYLSGAVTLARMQALRHVGFYDPAIFLYYEDDDLCMRLKAAGHEILLVPDAVAGHVGGGSIPRTRAYQWEKFFHISWSRLYIEAKVHGLAAAWGIGLPNLLKFCAKALGHALVGHGEKARRDLARAAGTLAWLLRRPASRTTRRAWPD
jgi:GT2 family glycosyltransferase